MARSVVDTVAHREFAVLAEIGETYEVDAYAHTNSHKFMLRDDVWDASDVIDVTDALRVVEDA